MTEQRKVVSKSKRTESRQDPHQRQPERTHNQSNLVGEYPGSHIDSMAALSIGEHVESLSRIASDELRAGFMMNLQQSYGNSYVQRVIDRIKVREMPQSSSSNGNESSICEQPYPSRSEINYDEGISENLSIQRQPEQSDPPAKEEKKPAFKITYKSDFQESIGSAKLNATLKTNAENLCNTLIKDSMVTGDISFNEGVRSPATAHQWHTAWMIRNGDVPIKKLKDLTDGKDTDGTQWWNKEWDSLSETEAMEKAKEHAKTIWSGAYAAEGYPVGDDHRLPCDCKKGITNHAAGNAIDISIPWTVDSWSKEANTQVDSAGLKRPVSTEAWHFELK